MRAELEFLPVRLSNTRVVPESDRIPTPPGSCPHLSRGVSRCSPSAGEWDFTARGGHTHRNLFGHSIRRRLHVPLGGVRRPIVAEAHDRLRYDRSVLAWDRSHGDASPVVVWHPAGVIFALSDTFSLYLPVALLYLAPIVLEHARANGYLLSRVRITRFASAVVAVLLLLHALTAMHGVLRARAFRAHEEIGSDEQPESLLGAGDRDPTDPIDIEGDEAGEQEAHQHLVAHVPAGDCAEGEEEQVRKELPKLVVLREEVGKREGALSQVHEQPSGCPLVGVRHIDAVRRDQEGGEADGKHGEADKERPDRCRHGIGGGCHGGGTETSGSCAPAVSA